MEDRSALLRELHSQVLGKVLEQDGGDKPRFEKELVESYFNEKRPIIGSEDSLLEAIKQIGGLYLLDDREKSVYRMSDRASSEIQDLAKNLIENGTVESIWTGSKETLYTLPELVPYYKAAYSKDEKLSASAKKILSKVNDSTKITNKKVADELHSNYLVSKGVETFSKRNIEKTFNYEKSLDWIIKKHIGFVGPRASEELAMELNLSEEIVNQTLYELEEQGVVQGGNFALGRKVPQYLLAEDVIYLEAQSH